MAFYRYTSVDGNTKTTTLVRSKSQLQGYTYRDGNDVNHIYERVSTREALRPAVTRANGIVDIFVVIFILLMFANIFSSVNSRPVFGELRPPTELTMDTLITTLTRTTDVDLLSSVDNIFDSIDGYLGIEEVKVSNDNSFWSSLQSVVNSIFNGIRSIVNGIIFAVELVINLVQVIYNLFRVLIIFFT